MRVGGQTDQPKVVQEVLTDLNISRYLILRLDALPFKETAKGDSSMEQALGSGHRCAAGYPDVKRKVDGHLLTAHQGWVLGEGGACTVHLWLQAVLDCLRHLPRWERERGRVCQQASGNESPRLLCVDSDIRGFQEEGEDTSVHLRTFLCL